MDELNHPSPECESQETPPNPPNPKQLFPIKLVAIIATVGIVVIVGLIVLLTLIKPSDDSKNSCNHQWIEADCSYPKTCRICQETTGAAKGHIEIIDASVEPTCTTEGLTQGKHCSLCGKVLVAQQETSALGHKWNMATCTTPKTCSVCQTTEGEPNGHTFENGECVHKVRLLLFYKQNMF